MRAQFDLKVMSGYRSAFNGQGAQQGEHQDRSRGTLIWLPLISYRLHNNDFCVEVIISDGSLWAAMMWLILTILWFRRQPHSVVWFRVPTLSMFTGNSLLGAVSSPLSSPTLRSLCSADVAGPGRAGGGRAGRHLLLARSCNRAQPQHANCRPGPRPGAARRWGCGGGRRRQAARPVRW